MRGENTSCLWDNGVARLTTVAVFIRSAPTDPLFVLTPRATDRQCKDGAEWHGPPTVRHWLGVCAQPLATPVGLALR